jgi:hypothetical protein
MFQRPEYTCYRAARPITVNGELGDPSWAKAPAVEFVLADTGARPKQRTTAKLLWDDQYLYIAFHCEDSDIWGTTTERDQDIYNQEVVEVFIDDDCDDYSYIEIEVSPLNAVLDLFMLNRNGQTRGLWDWDSEGMRTAVVVDGDPVHHGRNDRSWTVEIAIPMGDFMTAPHIPPHPGEVWHVNLYRIDRASWGDEYTAWSAPGIINYHTPQRFGRLVFSATEV